MAKLLSADLPADLELVVLFGSRAQGTATSSSDWDLGVRFSPGQGDPLRLYRLDVELATRLGCSSDAVDVVEHGQPLFERQPGLFGSFCSRAIRQWADWQRRQQKLAAERSQVLA